MGESERSAPLVYAFVASPCLFHSHLPFLASCNNSKLKKNKNKEYTKEAEIAVAFTLELRIHLLTKSKLELYFNP